VTTDWFRSIVVLGAAVIAVIGMTFGLTALIVPGAGVARAPDASPDASGGSEVPGAPPQLGDGPGAVIAISGDYTGHMVLTRQENNERYGLVGDDGTVIFEFGATEDATASPAQISFGSWLFFPEPDECTITPGEGDLATGLAPATIECTDLAEVRDKGTVSLSGEMRLAADAVGQRGVPQSGGSLAVGDQTWTFDGAFMALWHGPAIAGVDPENLILTDTAEQGTIAISRNIDSEETWVSRVIADGGETDVPEEACTIARRELGKPSPTTMTVELTIGCAEVEVPGLGPVPIEGTLIVDEVALDP
jgi:hypothetical protein